MPASWRESPGTYRLPGLCRCLPASQWSLAGGTIRSVHPDAAPIFTVDETGLTNVLPGALEKIYFFGVGGLAGAVIDALAHPRTFLGLREAARQSVIDRFDSRRVCLPMWKSLVRSIPCQTSCETLADARDTPPSNLARWPYGHSFIVNLHNRSQAHYELKAGGSV